MPSAESVTNFASPQREPREIVLASHHRLSNLTYVREILNALPHPAMIINAHRQIVLANDALVEGLNLRAPEDYAGKRPGELFNCIHAEKAPNGCGTATGCRVCDALLAVLDSQCHHRRAIREMRLTFGQADRTASLELLVSVTPFNVADRPYWLVNLTDIGHEKRRKSLERIFFHDVLNTASNILSLSRVIAEKESRANSVYPGLLEIAAVQLFEEIKSQRQLLAAENHELSVQIQDLDSLECLKATAATYRTFQNTRQIGLYIDRSSQAIALHSDRSLLLRVLSNLVKNALEAAAAGQVVTIGCRRKDETCQFWVHNPNPIQPDVQLQLFQRSFTTKGIGRGLGTYSAKLLTEQFLRGSISFSSSEQAGTCFEVCCPLSYPRIAA